jgi:hypothetical protein
MDESDDSGPPLRRRGSGAEVGTLVSERMS